MDTSEFNLSHELVSVGEVHDIASFIDAQLKIIQTPFDFDEILSILDEDPVLQAQLDDAEEGGDGSGVPSDRAIKKALQLCNQHVRAQLSVQHSREQRRKALSQIEELRREFVGATMQDALLDVDSFPMSWPSASQDDVADRLDDMSSGQSDGSTSKRLKAKRRAKGVGSGTTSGAASQAASGGHEVEGETEGVSISVSDEMTEARSRYADVRARVYALSQSVSAAEAHQSKLLTLSDTVQPLAEHLSTNTLEALAHGIQEAIQTVDRLERQLASSEGVQALQSALQQYKQTQ
eukprot:m.365686 g.365686  ORF g.365686 m.365686 type:complete len:293 (+) comp32599_c0_seq1:45-923(+)